MDSGIVISVNPLHPLKASASIVFTELGIFIDVNKIENKEDFIFILSSEECSYCNKQYNLLWDEVTPFTNPHKYYVDLSEKERELK